MSPRPTFNESVNVKTALNGDWHVTITAECEEQHNTMWRRVGLSGTPPPSVIVMIGNTPSANNNGILF